MIGPGYLQARRLAFEAGQAQRQSAAPGIAMAAFQGPMVQRDAATDRQDFQERLAIAQSKGGRAPEDYEAKLDYNTRLAKVKGNTFDQKMSMQDDRQEGSVYLEGVEQKGRIGLEAVRGSRIERIAGADRTSRETVAGNAETGRNDRGTKDRDERKAARLQARDHFEATELRLSAALLIDTLDDATRRELERDRLENDKKYDEIKAQDAKDRLAHLKEVLRLGRLDKASTESARREEWKIETMLKAWKDSNRNADRDANRELRRDAVKARDVRRDAAIKAGDELAVIRAAQRAMKDAEFFALHEEKDQSLHPEISRRIRRKYEDQIMADIEYIRSLKSK